MTASDPLAHEQEETISEGDPVVDDLRRGIARSAAE